MGNSTGLAYDILDPIEYKSNNFWQLNQGCKKSDTKEGKQNVSIFRFPKASKPDKLNLAQKSIQKLKTIRHPYVLSFVDAVEIEDTLILVTESCTPLEQWLKNVVSDPKIPKQYLFYELAWGFKCVLQALEFFHSNCSLFHGNLSLQSIFVTPNGDWKLSGLELACNVNNNDEITHFITNHFILENDYISPERSTLRDHDAGKIESVLKTKLPPYYIDIYSFGICVEKAFKICNETITGSFEKHITLAIHQEIRKRPTAKKLLQTSTFNSDYIKILESVQEFSVKNPKEILESITQIEPLLPQIAVSICNYKLLPGVCKVLQLSITDFQNRDLREQSRQGIVICVDLLSKLASMKKLDETVFQQECLQSTIQLWTMTDRTVRTSLLNALKHLSELIPNVIVNKNLFDNMIAGFSDSNAKLRESTLMALLYIVDKLDEVQLQDRLVRSITNLQNDPEASIRTNAVIFLGKIASKLKEPVRMKVLCNAFVKSMKDNFFHCRMAGLKTANACLKLMDVTQTATKLIPQCSILLLDKSAEVRTLAMNLLQACVEKMKEHHQYMMDTEKDHKEEAGGGSSSGNGPNSSMKGGTNPTSTSGSTVADSLLGSIASWSLQGLATMNIDSSTKVDDPNSHIGDLKKPYNRSQPESTTPLSASNSSNDFSSHSKTPATITKSSSTSINKSSTSSTTAAAAAALQFDDDDFDTSNNTQSNEMNFDHINTSSKHPSSASWGDDGLDDALKFDDDDNDDGGNNKNRMNHRNKDEDDDEYHDSVSGPSKFHNTFDSPRKATKPKSSASSVSSSSTSSITSLNAMSSSTSTDKKPVKVPKAPKVAAVKLEVSKDEGWDDF